MTSSNKYKQIVDELISKTDAGILRWRETAETETFQVSFQNYSIMLTDLSDYRIRTSNYVVAILNSEGKNVDSFSENDIGSEYKEKLAELYQKARRQALGADKALDEILNALKDAR